MKTIARRRGGSAEKRDEKGREKIAKHHETEGDGMADLDYAKDVGPVRGEHGKHTSARAPRKSGGGVGADSHPFSSARAGTEPKGRHTMSGD
jgi:hypothetical protein